MNRRQLLTGASAIGLIAGLRASADAIQFNTPQGRVLLGGAGGSNGAPIPGMTLTFDYLPSRDGLALLNGGPTMAGYAADHAANPSHIWQPRFDDGIYAAKGSADTYDGIYSYNADPAYTWSNGYTPFAINGSGNLVIAGQTVASVSPAFAGGEIPTNPATSSAYTWVSGLISTQNSFTQAGGYFEMNAKLPDGRADWPAFWLFSAENTHPPEIDVIEIVGGYDPTTNYRATVIKAGAITTQQSVVNGADLSLAFHRYGMYFDGNNVQFYLDGIAVGSPVSIATNSEFGQRFYMLASMQVGSTVPLWVPAPDGTTPNPSNMEIKWIRAWQRTGPVEISLSNTAYLDSFNVGDTVATISVVNFGASSGNTLTIASDPDSAYSISGTSLKLAQAIPETTKATHNVTILATDSSSKTLSRQFTMNVLAATPSGTNLITSQDMTPGAGYWSLTNVTAPSASVIMETATTGQHAVSKANITRSAGINTFRVSVDHDPTLGRSEQLLQVFDGNFDSVGGGFAYFNLNTKLVDFSEGLGAWSLTAYPPAKIPGSSAWRCAFDLLTDASTTNITIFPQLALGLNQGNYLGDVTKGATLTNFTIIAKPAPNPGNFPDTTDYLASWITSPTVFSNTTTWPRTNISTATLEYNLDTTSTATLFSENSTSNTIFSIYQTITSKAAGTRYRRLCRFDVKAFGDTFIRMQIANPGFTDGFNVFAQLVGAGTVYFIATPNAGTVTTYAINNFTIVELAGGFYRCEIDYYTNTPDANVEQQMFLVTGNNDFGSHVGVIGNGIICRQWTDVDETASLTTQTSVPANSVLPVVWGPNITANSGDRLTVWYGTWTNQPTSFTYQWTSNGTSIPGATNYYYVATTATANTTIVCKVTPTNNFGTGTAASSNGSIFNGVDYTQQWLTANNFPTAANPTNPSATPSYGSFIGGTANNLAYMDFTPTGNVTNRTTLDSLVYYTTMNGASNTSYPATAVTSPIDNPTSGSAYALMRHYPTSNPYNLHNFTTNGLNLGVISKNNGTAQPASGNCYAGGIRLQTKFKPGMYAEFTVIGPTNPFAWTPVWLFTGDQVSPGVVAGSGGNPVYAPDGTHTLINRAALTVNGTPVPSAGGAYWEIDVNDWWKSTLASDIGHSVNSGCVFYMNRISSLTTNPPYTYFLANSGDFARSANQVLLQNDSWSDGPHVIGINWRVLSTSDQQSGTVRRDITQLDYIKDGVIFRSEYLEYINNYYVDPITGLNTEPGMHFLIGGQGWPSFLSGVGSSSISNWSSYGITLKSAKIWDTALDPTTLTLPTNGVAAYNVLNMDNVNPVAGQAWSANIQNKSTGTGSANTNVTATSSDGTVLTVSGTSISGTFASTGSPTISLTETPYSLVTGATTSNPVGLPTTTNVPVVVGSSAITPVTVTFTDHAETSTAASTFTWSSKNFAIGTANSTRQVAAIITSRVASQSETLNSVTIGGISATKVVEKYAYDSGTNSSITSMWVANVPTGTTATVSAVFSTTMLRAGCIVYTINGSNGTVPSGAAIGSGTTSGGASPESVTATQMTLPGGAGAVVVCYTGVTSGTPTATLSSFNQDLAPTSISSSSFYLSGSSNTTGSQTYGVTWSGNIPAGAIIVAAAWARAGT